MAFESVPDVSKILAVFALTLFVCNAIYRWFQNRSYPPGPVGLPLLGYAPFLGKRPHLTLRDLGKRYGDIFSFYIGPRLMICLNEYHTAKALLSHDLTLARDPNSFKFLTGSGGFSGKNGEEWQEQRRFAIQNMRNLGMGKGLWETMIQEYCAELVQDIMSWRGAPTNIEMPLNFSQSKNSVSLLFGRLLDKNEDKEDLVLIRDVSKELMNYFSSVGLNITLPWLTKIMEIFHLSGYKEFLVMLRAFENIFRKEVQKRMKSKDELTKEDFIGSYLQEMEKRKNDTKQHFFTVENLLGNLFILFVAGNDSTLASVNWLLLLMTKYPEIQRKIHDEIDAVIGRDGIVYYDDRVKLPFTMATILEMTRYVTINPINPIRYPLDTLEFNGYTIPKGCHIISNNWAIMHDTRNYTNPMEFKPERFLDETGAKVVKQPGYSVFSFGKRNCPGEGVAMMSMYLYFVSIMQKFRVTLPHGQQPDMEPTFGGALFPKPHDFCFIER